jgi:hypothetical protein
MCANDFKVCDVTSSTTAKIVRQDDEVKEGCLRNLTAHTLRTYNSANVL